MCTFGGEVWPGANDFAPFGAQKQQHGMNVTFQVVELGWHEAIHRCCG